ncbi:hypothetical protein Mal4_05330 [Maioricimonas rarisocia]|uniref:Uncharacterized protein n=1 Tax=Maioricimonas rarisocia TaxID=2528026 RepID=A0A517Z1E9_9PLAN|nr:hypothetical protein [Maioricimonas rarisocia]QDU36249.1 hypothetical protein Mal4_05330 [Maioricimonas rarisocia]
MSSCQQSPPQRSSRPNIRRIGRKDLEHLSRIVGKIHGLEREPEHLDWKYFQNPAGAPLSAVAEVDGRTISHTGAIRTWFRVAGEARQASQEVDIFVDEALRSARAFFHLYRERVNINEHEDVDFMFGFTIDKTSKISRKAMKFQRVGAVPRLVHVIDSRHFFRRRLGVKPVADALGLAANAAIALSRPKQHQVPDGMRLVDIARFDARFDALWDRIRDDYPIMLQKDASYLQWRYRDIRDVAFDVVALENASDSRVEGFCVVGINPLDPTRGCLVDLVTPRQSDEAVSAVLIAAAIERLRERQVATVAAWAFPHMHTYSVLQHCGFRLQPVEGQDLVCRHTGSGDPDEILPLLMQQENWCVAMGDSDWN